MRFSWAKTPTMDEISRVNRGLMCPAVTTGRVLGGAVVGAIVRHAGAIVRLGQRGAGGGRADAPRRGWRGYFAHRACSDARTTIPARAQGGATRTVTDKTDRRLFIRTSLRFSHVGKTKI